MKAARLSNLRTQRMSGEVDVVLTQEEGSEAVVLRPLQASTYHTSRGDACLTVIDFEHLEGTGGFFRPHLPVGDLMKPSA